MLQYDKIKHKKRYNDINTKDEDVRAEKIKKIQS